MNEHKKKNSIKQYQRIKTEFSGTHMTQYAGLTVISDFLNQLNLRNHFDQHFPTQVHNATKHFNWQVLLSVILSNLSGVHRMQAMEQFTSDPLVMKLLNLPCRIDASTIANRLTGFGQKGAVLMRESQITQIQQWIAQPNVTDITFDLDSTVLGVYGHQEGAEKGYNPHKKGQKSYHPLLAFVSELKLVAHSWFREGSAYTSNGVCEFAKELKERIPDNVKNVMVRADSGFFCGAFLDLMESWGWRYLIKVKLKNMEELLRGQKWTLVDSRVSICEFTYQCKSWKRARKLSAIRILKDTVEVSMMGRIEQAPVYEYACYVSTMDGLPIVDMHRLYCQRGTSENWIEQVKNQLLAGKTMTQNFYANDIFWQCAVFAYNASVMMRYVADRNIWRQEHKSFRSWFVCVPAKVVMSGRYVIVKLYKPYYYRKHWLDFEARALAAA